MNIDILNKEKEYLKSCFDIIDYKTIENDKNIREIIDSIDTSLYDYFNGEIKKDIDAVHIAQNDDFYQLSKELLNEKSHLNMLLKENAYLGKMKFSPYFSKINFNNEDYYIGISSLFDNDSNLVIIDWRAPIADLYYESELGDTYYKLENGKVIRGNLTLKRQFIIENGELTDYIDSSLMIDDTLLIKELSRNSSDKLKNIVSTIQKEQNKAIKADIYKDLLVFGVAGSGKTSVAMHRISYLIYRNNKIYNSNKIAVLSPNNYFYNYIDSILPSLGENNVINFDITYLIEVILKKYNINFKNKERFYMDLFNDYENNKIKEVSIKDLDIILSKEISNYIKDVDIRFYSFYNSYDDICSYFSSRLLKTSLKTAKFAYKEEILDKVYKEYFKPSKGEIKDLEEQINQMFYKIDCFSILNKFLNNKYKENDPIDYYDAVYLSYIIFKVRDIKDFNIYNHLVIDEIQDYSDIEINIINTLFDCKKTMVGDINQKLYSDFNSNFYNCNKLELLNSYRCSKEIFDFINSLIPSNRAISVIRNGHKPIIYKCNNFNVEVSKVIDLINNSNGTVGIICKNGKECNKWYISLKDKIEVKRVTDKSRCNILVCTIYECKGLEFDNVIVVDIDSNNYKYDIEKNWLYIACSRAMHNLSLIYSSNISYFIENIDENLYISK